MGAAAEIAVAIRELATASAFWEPVDLIVVTRGGGSIEDLWEFNEEIVARTIIDISVPVVSAIGHEIDFTICDFVADLRAPTPSAAAELIVPDIIDLRRRIDELIAGLPKRLQSFVDHQRTRLRFLSERTLARELLKRMRDAQQQFDLARDSIGRSVAQQIENYRRSILHTAGALQARSPAHELLMRRNRFAEVQRLMVAAPPRALENLKQSFRRVEGILRVLGPEATLRRGYSLTKTEDGKLIRSAKEAHLGLKLTTRVADGEFKSEVVT
jgi:exodeoxyribonuclease VII large subunit